MAEAHYFLSVALARMGNGKRAVQALEICLKLQPRTAAAHHWLAKIHDSITGNRKQAEMHREQARQLTGGISP